MSTEVKVQFAATSLKELRQQIMSFLLEDGAIRVVDEAPAQQVMNLVPPQIVEPEVVQPEAKVETAPLEPVMSAEPATDASPTETEVEPSTSAETASSHSTELTYEDVRKAVLDLASVTGPEKVKETLATFGLTNAKEADPGLWPQIIEKFVSEAETAKAAAAKAKGGA